MGYTSCNSESVVDGATVLYRDAVNDILKDPYKREVFVSKLRKTIESDEKKMKNTTIGQWPSRGGVEFQNLRLRYREELPMVLHGINLKIPAGTSLGICGRTGSGKSSLLLSLMRMVEPESGSTQLVDGVDIGSIGLHDLRRALCIIPQDPVIFTGTVRFNLDPFNEVSEAKLFEAVKLAQLEHKLGTWDESKGETGEYVIDLDAEVADGGSNFSHGERQLLALARAIVRKPEGGAGSGSGYNGILLLDEATSSLDHDLDRRIQDIIRTQVFTNSTIITIAHRIQTIADYDNVAVLDEGRLVEYGPPQELLKNANSHFYKLAADAIGGGNGSSANLLGKTASSGNLLLRGGGVAK